MRALQVLPRTTALAYAAAAAGTVALLACWLCGWSWPSRTQTLAHRRRRRRQRVVVVGGGFAGAEAARILQAHACRGMPRCEVVLIDECGELEFTPVRRHQQCKCDAAAG